MAAESTLPERADVLALAESVEARAVREGAGGRAVELHGVAARLLERVWRVEGREQDAKEALDVYRAAAHDPAAPGACEAALDAARLAGDVAHDAATTYAELYRAQRRFASSVEGDAGAPNACRREIEERPRPARRVPAAAARPRGHRRRARGRGSRRAGAGRHARRRRRHGRRQAAADRAHRVVARARRGARRRRARPAGGVPHRRRGPPGRRRRAHVHRARRRRPGRRPRATSRGDGVVARVRAERDERPDRASRSTSTGARGGASSTCTSPIASSSTSRATRPA